MSIAEFLDLLTFALPGSLNIIMTDYTFFSENGSSNEQDHLRQVQFNAIAIICVSMLCYPVENGAHWNLHKREVLVLFSQKWLLCFLLIFLSWGVDMGSVIPHSDRMELLQWIDFFCSAYDMSSFSTGEASHVCTQNMVSILLSQWLLYLIASNYLNNYPSENLLLFWNQSTLLYASILLMGVYLIVLDANLTILFQLADFVFFHFEMFCFDYVNFRLNPVLDSSDHVYSCLASFTVWYFILKYSEGEARQCNPITYSDLRWLMHLIFFSSVAPHVCLDSLFAYEWFM